MVVFPVETRHISPQTSRRALVPTHPPIQRVPGPFLPRFKPSTRDSEHSPASSAEVESKWSYISTLPNAFRVCSVY
jgi:hypothetical protein